jgi:Retroviral aspartyl protease
MRIDGEWLEFNDGVTRPVVRGTVAVPGGEPWDVTFLVDTGADRTVLTSDFYSLLVQDGAGTFTSLAGVGGTLPGLIVEAQIGFVATSRLPITIRGPVTVFSQPDSIDIPILGRDILNVFAVIVDRSRDGVTLLTPKHDYTIL